MIWKEKKKKKKPESDWSASLLVLSPRQCPHRHQHFVYSLSVMLCLFRLGTHRHTNTRTVLLEVEERRGGRGWREKELGGEVSMRGFFLLNVMYSEVLSACGSQTHCVLQVLINSVLYFEYSSVCQRLYFLVPLYFLMITSLFIIKYIQMMRDIIFLPFLFFFLIHGTAGREVVTLWWQKTLPTFLRWIICAALHMKFIDIDIGGWTEERKEKLKKIKQINT